MKQLLGAACMALGLMLSGCGGGSDAEPVSPQGEPVASTSQALGASGGTVSLQGLALTLSPLALSEAVEVGLQKETIGSEAIARFRLSPAGQVLDVPAELQFSSPGLPGNAMFFWEVADELWMIPGTVTGGVLRASLSSLGYATTASSLGRALPQSLSTRARAQAVAPSEGASLVVQVPNCTTHVQALSNRLKGVTDQDRAVGIYNDLIATQAACAGVQAQLLQQRSCEALETAQLNARTELAESFGSFQAITVPLFAAEAFVQSLGAECTQVNPALTSSLVEAKFDQFLQVLQGQLVRGDFAQEASARDMGVLMDYERSCQLMDLGTMCDRLTTVIYPDLLDGMRQAAFDECRTHGTPLVVSQFYALGSQRGNDDKFFDHGRFSLADVEADLSYCANPRLNLRVFSDALNFPEEITDRAATLTPLNGLGNYTRTRAVAVPRNGSLQVSGQLAALRCPDGTSSKADLVVRLGTHEVARRSVGSGDAYPLDTLPLDLVVSRMLALTSLDPELTTGFTLFFNREGGGCSDGLNPVMGNPFTLFELKVNLPGPSTGVFRGRLVFTHQLTNLSGGTTGGSQYDFSADVELVGTNGLTLTSLQASLSVNMISVSIIPFGQGDEKCSFIERQELRQQSGGTTSAPARDDWASFQIDLAAATWKLREVKFTVLTVGQFTNIRSYSDIKGCAGFPLNGSSETQPTSFNTQHIMSFFNNNDPFSTAPLSGVVTQGSDGRRTVSYRGQTTRSLNGRTETHDVVLELKEMDR